MALRLALSETKEGDKMTCWQDLVIKEDSMEKPLVVTTEWGGVFFGYGEEPEDGVRVITLRDCRMCVAWDASVKGMPGLASGQSLARCKISPPVPKVKLYGVTGLFEATQEAEKEWIKQYWN